ILASDDDDILDRVVAIERAECREADSTHRFVLVNEASGLYLGDPVCPGRQAGDDERSVRLRRYVKTHVAAKVQLPGHMECHRANSGFVAVERAGYILVAVDEHADRTNGAEAEIGIGPHLSLDQVHERFTVAR